jgi:hypothetical protein
MVFCNVCMKPMAGGLAQGTALNSSFDHAGHFGTATDFAFACLILENNCQSWMRKGRDHKHESITDCDDQKTWKNRQFHAD